MTPCVCVYERRRNATPRQTDETESHDGGVCPARHTRLRPFLHTILTLKTHYFTSKSISKPHTFASTLLVLSGWVA